MRPKFLVALFLAGLAPGLARGESAVATADAGKALDNFHAALAAGDRDAALAHLAPDVVIFEAGGAELSRDEYAHHHLAGDMEYLAATKTERLSRRSEARGDVVWILTLTRTTGSFQGKEVASNGAETAVLAPSADGWRIVHLHWSSRAAKRQ